MGICTNKEIAESYVGLMLHLAHGCGLIYVDEAYHNFMQHWDCFFSGKEYRKEVAFFVDALKAATLVRANPPESSKEKFRLSEETIVAAANRLNVPLYIAWEEYHDCGRT